MTPALPLLPFPPISWWQLLAQHDYLVSAQIPYNKSQHPNRYSIATADGKHYLSLPLSGGRDQQHCCLADLQLSYAEDWPCRHWRTIASAYGRAAYWAHFAPELEELFRDRTNLYSEFCFKTVWWAAKQLGLAVKECQSAVNVLANAGQSLPITYYQVFDERNGFLPNLSMLDLILNEGPAAARLLKGG